MLAVEPTRPVWLTVPDAARYVGLPSPQALYMAVRRGQIPAHRFGRRLRFRPEDLDAAMKRIPAA